MFIVGDIITGIGASRAPFTDQANECTTTTCYPNPSFFNTPTNCLGAPFCGQPGPYTGICTNSATYVEVDGGTTLALPTTGYTGTQTANAYVFYDFDVRITVLGTGGVVSITIVGSIGTALSREMVVTGMNAGAEQQASLQVTLLVSATGGGGVATWLIQAHRTGGTGMICLDGFEGTTFVLLNGGTPLPP